MYEGIKKPLLPRRIFFKKLIRNIAAGLLISFTSLLIGMSGYHFIEKLSWVDSYENAAMILSGMGPVNNPVTTSGKLFAGTYALFSGLIIIVIIGVMFAPIFHRFFHKFLVDDSVQPKGASPKKDLRKTGEIKPPTDMEV